MPVLNETRFKFTNSKLKALPANDIDSRSTDQEYTDTEVSNLKLLVGKTGSKRYLVRYQIKSKKRSLTIGKFPDINVNDARSIARKHLTQVASGVDPKQERENQKLMPTLNDYFNDSYLPYIKQNKRSWKHDLQRYTDYVSKRFGNKYYDEVSALDIQRLQMDMLSGEGFTKIFAKATCNRTLALLKTMGQQAISWGIIEVNQANKIKLLKEDNTRTRYFTIGEMQKIIKQALKYPNIFSGRFIALLLYTGVRKMELLTAQWKHLDKVKRKLYVPMTKSGKSREIYLSDEMMKLICELPKRESNPYIFSSLITGKHISEPRWAYDVILKKAGINRKEVCFHTCRHSVATALISSGRDLYDVMIQLGHANIASSQRYSKVTEQRQRSVGQTVSDLISI
ncbi:MULTISPECIES: site-specific integrase [unclassified Colwellia]|uniref:site-specific integrase n=1 Tax=unclassified Colwellia TaxID=196834 RepID=UPI0015F5EFD2|nr:MULTISPECIES: site-specific integrase [unclassified Colwellia]MBA6353415.1 site-specific integrase [Colwellia sp. BRX9-1]MBA6357861.1 site-specific integrase [Colwellia sp. BRX8-3]MBA6359774.1 site-specific integrase [Colwellia sp. BRX8-6]MBA6368294.1 site-specific integrase [Colwellia sp. BRX8-5]MBA6377459.1 site-specific integrase [Colwellia sp. BRX8-2]